VSNYKQLATVLGNIPRRDGRAAIDLTNKRVDTLIEALVIADSGVVHALEELLQYTGGWDLKDPNHPIVKAIKVRETLKRAGVQL
jgi:hypothetical protein